MLALQDPPSIQQVAESDSRGLQDFYDDHLNDPNFDLRVLRPSGRPVPHLVPQAGTTEGDAGQSSGSSITTLPRDQFVLEEEIYEESPYPEVRAAVGSVDDPQIPVNTIRMWFLGLGFVFICTVFNQVLVFRYPSVFFSGVLVQIISLPCGRLLARILPRTVFTTFGYKWTLNPGPFSVKEHVCVTIMGSISTLGVYSMETVICRKVFYGMEVPYSHQVLLALGTQFFGFSLAGILRRFAVWPARMLWPNVLASCALYSTLHQTYSPVKGKGRMSRNKFFLLAALGAFIWQWVPTYLFTALSMFNWVCWIYPESATVNALFGGMTGLGMSVLTFDWSMIAYSGSPLVSPWWSQSNVAVSWVIFGWIIIPAAYFSNAFYSSHFPASSNFHYDNTGQRYQVSEFMTDGLFDQAKYSSYSPPFLSMSFALSYGYSFAAFSAIIVHTLLWYRKDILRQLRRTLKDEHDIHSRLMQNYAEVSPWWYITTGVIATVFMVVAVVIVPTQLPVWALALALAIGVAFALPLAIFQAIANQFIAVNVFSQLVVGYTLPGRPIATIIFKAVTFTTTAQSILFLGDLKTGHYMKIPPRVMFMVQMVATIVTTLLVIFVESWMFENITDICSPRQKHGFVCPGSNTFFTSSVVWGGVGPGRLFSPGRLYSPLLWYFLCGAILPIPFYLLAKRYPLGLWRYISIPVFFGSMQAIPTATGLNMASWLLTGFTFNFVIRRFRQKWWLSYNYILSAALDFGTVLTLFAVFFFVQLPKGGVSLNWWGNEVWMNTADAEGIPLKPVPEGSIIGPTSW